MLRGLGCNDLGWGSQGKLYLGHRTQSPSRWNMSERGRGEKFRLGLLRKARLIQCICIEHLPVRRSAGPGI